MSLLVTVGASSASPAAMTRTASNSRSAVTSLSRNPLAPTRSASKTYSSRSKVVRISTRGAWSSSVSCRGASMPSVPGIRMSIRTTSGLRSRQVRTASAPSAAVAEHVEVRLRVEHRGEPGPHHLVVVGDDDADGHDDLRFGGQVGLDENPPPGGGARPQRPAGAPGSLAHAEQAVPALPAPSWPVPPRRPPAAGAVVADPQLQRMVVVAELDIDRRARRVPPGVGERLLHDAVGGELDARVEVGDRAGDDEPGRVAAVASRAASISSSELRQPGLRVPAATMAPAPRRPRGARRAAAASRSGQPARCRRSR